MEQNPEERNPMIPVQNIYYMLTYVLPLLRENVYRDISAEKFENISDMCAAILIKGITQQVKNGLNKEYKEKNEPLSTPKGKLNISDSLKNRNYMNNRLVCSYDDFTVNSYFNRIIKSTVFQLLKSDIDIQRKRILSTLMSNFCDVQPLDLRTVNWNIPYSRNNKAYKLLISVCYLFTKGLIQTTCDGKLRVMDFLDEKRTYNLYEKFILEYYRKEFPQLNVCPSRIKWQLDNDCCDMLPVMQSDISLSDKSDRNILIIDAKYYSHNTQELYGKHTLISSNLYQIFTYVKNKEAELSGKPHKISGMLLYAKTDDEIQPDNEYSMSGNKITVRTLDLNCDFTEIKRQLNGIAEKNFFLNSSTHKSRR